MPTFQQPFRVKQNTTFNPQGDAAAQPQQQQRQPLRTSSVSRRPQGVPQQQQFRPPQGFSAQQLQQAQQSTVQPLQSQLGSLDQQIALAQAQFNQANRQGNRSLFNRPQAGFVSIDAADERARLTQLQNQRAGLQRQLQQQQRASEQQALTQSELQRQEDARNQLFGLAGARVDELRNDPTDQLILDTLRNRIQGEGLPFDDRTVNALLSDASEQAAAAEQAQLANLPGRPGDPAFEAARRELLAQRQGRLQDANRAINTQRSLTNFDAVTGALNQAAAVNAARNQAITGADRRLQDLLASLEFQIPDNPTFQDFLQLAQRRG